VIKLKASPAKSTPDRWSPSLFHPAFSMPERTAKGHLTNQLVIVAATYQAAVSEDPKLRPLESASVLAASKVTSRVFFRIHRFVFVPVRLDDSLVGLDLCLAIIIIEIGTDPRGVQFSSRDEALGDY
jgi:hypothetical protein